MSGKINLAQKLAAFADYWSPRTVAQLNGHDVMVVKVRGEFVWHTRCCDDVGSDTHRTARPA